MKKIVCILIVLELVMSGLGYCGHSHDNDHHSDTAQVMMIHSHSNNGDQHVHTHTVSTNDDCCSNSDLEERCAKFHCSCLGNFLAEINNSSAVIYAQVRYLTPPTIPSYYFAFTRQVYRPPTL